MYSIIWNWLDLVILIVIQTQQFHYPLMNIHSPCFKAIPFVSISLWTLLMESFTMVIKKIVSLEISYETIDCFTPMSDDQNYDFSQSQLLYYPSLFTFKTDSFTVFDFQLIHWIGIISTWFRSTLNTFYLWIIVFIVFDEWLQCCITL